MFGYVILGMQTLVDYPATVNPDPGRCMGWLCPGVGQKTHGSPPWIQYVDQAVQYPAPFLDLNRILLHIVNPISPLLCQPRHSQPCFNQKYLRPVDNNAHMIAAKGWNVCCLKYVDIFDLIKVFLVRTEARVTLDWIDNFVTKYLRDSTFEHGREWGLLKSALRLDWYSNRTAVYSSRGHVFVFLILIRHHLNHFMKCIEQSPRYLKPEHVDAMKTHVAPWIKSCDGMSAQNFEWPNRNHLIRIVEVSRMGSWLCGHVLNPYHIGLCGQSFMRLFCNSSQVDIYKFPQSQ